MSFGIAFALPAYDNPPNVGPFTQAGPTLSLNFSGAQYSVWDSTAGALTSKPFSQIVTFTRASTGTYTDSAGILQTANTNTPRFDYNPTTLASLGLLVEEARTNLLTYSEDLSNIVWSKGLMTATGGNAAPNATNTAYLVNSALETSALYPSQSLVVASSTTYILSVFVKVGTASHLRFRFGIAGTSTSIWYSIAGKTFSNAGTLLTGISAVDSYSGWVRVSVAIAYGASDGGARSIAVSPTAAAGSTTAAGTVYLWGYQMEAGAFPTSYTPTTTAAATRAADLAAVNTFSPWFNSSQGTLFGQFEASANTFTAYINISNGVTAQNSIHIDNDGGLMRAVSYSGSAAVATLSLGAIGTVGAVNKVATSYALNDFKANRNGGSIVADTVGALPVGLTQMNIGADPSGTAANVINGHIQSITYYPRSMANYELQALTS